MELKSLPSYKSLKNLISLSNQDINFLNSSLKTAKNIFLKNDNKVIVFAGPCSIHDENSAIIYAKKLRNLQKNLKNIFIIMRVFFEKARSKNSWRGFLYDPELNSSCDIEEGIKKVRRLLIEITKLKVPICTEFVDPNISSYFDDLITWGFIGARTSASSLHRHYASSLSIPVGFKNSLDGDLEIPINATTVAKSPQSFVSIDENGKICNILSKGNNFSHIVLRGSKTKVNYDDSSLEDAVKKMNFNEIATPIVIDCSHGNSQSDHRNQITAFRHSINSIIKNQYPIIGLMLESNLFEGNQKTDLLKLRFGLSITDPCIDFETTGKLLLEADEMLNKSAIHRN
ncbi:MAG: 3-deoxy-7-phosphoheptulonate synthase [Parachlamydiales bacterium]|jgi:3-deoxy-7-phosphoheptulonate synthase